MLPVEVMRRKDRKNLTLPSDLVDNIPRTITSESAEYDCLNLIGSGSYGKCYKVMHKATAQRYACKVLSLKCIENDDHRRLIQSEIGIHSSLRHEHVVQFLESFNDDQFIYIIQSLCSNNSLASLLKQRDLLKLNECRYVLNQILKGLFYIHRKGIIHRDLKCANILIDTNIQMKICDFGLAIYVEDAPSEANILCGTTNYLAPEVLQLNGYKRRSDVWAFGVIAFILTHGHKPFEAESEVEVVERIKRADYRMAPDLDHDCQLFLQRIFEIDVAKRLTAEECLKTPFFQTHAIPDVLPSLLFMSSLPEMSQSDRNHIKNVGLAENSIRKKVQYPDILIQVEPDLYESTEMMKIADILRSVFQCFDDVCESHSCNDDASISNIRHQRDLEPQYWIVKWSYDRNLIGGFAYQISDASIGMLFYCGKHFMFTPNKMFWILNSDGELERIKSNPSDMELVDQVQRFKEFQNRLNKGGYFEVVTPHNRYSLPHLVTWFQTDESMIMLLSNSTVQINFNKTHKKVLISPEKRSITFVSDFICPANFKTVSFDFLAAHQFSTHDFAMFKYVTALLLSLIESLLPVDSDSP